MRIIAGEFRSRVLESPRGMATRPTSDRLRETLFNVLQGRIAGARFLDLYAGSGANGFEALSRGAAEAVMVEQAAPALAAIRANVAALRVGERVRVEGLAVRRWLEQRTRAAAGVDGGQPGIPAFDVVFLDPPYAEAGEYDATMEALGNEAAALLASGGVVVAEHRRAAGSPRSSGKPGEKNLPGDAVPAECYGHLRRTRVLVQGDAALSFYGRA